jgi:solute:Na+ symporter, SSS family
MAESAASLQGPDYFVIVAYFVIMLGIGAYFYRYMRAMKDYFVGGNSIPWWLSGISYYMGSFSAFAFVFYSALAYKYGWLAVTLFWVTVPATFISTYFFAARWRRARINSPVEYLESRYGATVRQLFVWQGVPVKVIDDALKLIAIGTFLSVGLGMNLNQTMLWSGGIMLSYTFMGGIWAVAITDFVQFVVLAVAVVVLFPLAIYRAGGMTHMIEQSPHGFFHLTSDEYGWGYVLAAALLYILAWGTNWGLVQKFYCVPTEKDARKVGWLVIALNLIGPPLMFIPAMAARIFLPPLEDSQWVYPKLCAALLPAGMLGLMVAAMFSATMSMLSSDYNVCASVLTNDVYRRLFRPGASEKELVLVGRLTTLLIGAISIGAAFMISAGKDDRMFRNMITLFSVATAPAAIPMLGGLLWSWLTNRGAFLGFLGGVFVGVILLFTVPDEAMILGFTIKQENVILISTTLVTTLLIVLAAWLEQPDASERQKVRAFMTQLDTPIGALPQDSVADGSAGISPFRVVGVCTSLIGIVMLTIAFWIQIRLAWQLDVGIGVALLIIGGVISCLSRPLDRVQQPGG